MSDDRFLTHGVTQVTEGRLYIFYLGFHYKKEVQRERLAALVGKSGRSVAAGEYAFPGIVQLVHLTLRPPQEAR